MRAFFFVVHRGGRCRVAAAGLLLCSMALPCRAAPPPVSVWVVMKVAQCEAVTLEAPSTGDRGERLGAPHRTVQVTGEVLTAGLEPGEGSAEEIQAWMAQARAQLPAPGTQLSLVMRQWEAPFCRSVLGTVQRFRYEQACDTLPRTGSCLSPHPVARPVSP